MDQNRQVRIVRFRWWTRLISIVGFASIACASTYADRPIYNERFTIDTQVDAARHVEEVIVSNTAHGDYKFEFMAQLAGSRERWTITYEHNSAYDFVQHVDVNVVWRYTLTYEDAFTTPRIAISVPGNVATISVLNAASDPNLLLFQQLCDETASEQAVVMAVALQMKTMLPELQQPIPQPNPVQQCVTFSCPAPQPSWCAGENLHCLETHACCVAYHIYAGCLTKCECKHGTMQPPNPADCDLIIDPIIENNLAFCLSILMNCVAELH